MRFVLIQLKRPKNLTIAKNMQDWNDFLGQVRAGANGFPGVAELSEELWQLPLDDHLQGLFRFLEAVLRWGYPYRVSYLEHDVKWEEPERLGRMPRLTKD